MANENQTMTVEQIQAMQAEIARLKADNLKLSQKGSTIKLTEKGGVAVYGLGRFPVTLYKSQWTKLLAMVPEIQAFIEANADKLTEKAKAQDDTVNVA